MGLIIILLALVMGCSDDGETHTNTYPADAGPDVEIVYVDAGHDAEEDAGKNCTPIVWSFGPERFCEQCVCPGTECRTHALGEDLVVGTCDENLKCSAECRDPLWYEMDAGPN